MKPTKRLTLSRETVSELATDELRGLAAGNQPVITPNCPTVYAECPSDPIMGCTVTQVTRYATCIC